MAQAALSDPRVMNASQTAISALGTCQSLSEMGRAELGWYPAHRGEIESPRATPSEACPFQGPRQHARAVVSPVLRQPLPGAALNTGGASLVCGAPSSPSAEGGSWEQGVGTSGFLTPLVFNLIDVLFNPDPCCWPGKMVEDSASPRALAPTCEEPKAWYSLGPCSPSRK